MATDTERQAGDADGGVSTEDIIAVVSGIATQRTAQRVWAQSVSDEKARYQIAWSLPPDDEEEQIRDAIADAPDRIPERLQQRARMLTERFASVQRPSLRERALTALETVLNLPCFAPALAASDVPPSPKIVSQSVTTEEGVRIEFQQLPVVPGDTDTGTILRVIVDASITADATYTRAMLTLATGNDPLASLSVPLNVQGRGLLDVRDLPLRRRRVVWSPPPVLRLGGAKVCQPTRLPYPCIHGSSCSPSREPDRSGYNPPTLLKLS
jgi:hypothetical protein